MNNKYLSGSFTKIYSKFLRNKKKYSSLKKLLYFYDKIISLTIKKPKYSSDKKKILIIYNLAFGDGVILNATLDLYKKIYKDYIITFACQKGLEKLYKNENYFDEIISVNFTKATVNLKERYKLLKKIKEKYYDIVITPVEMGIWSTDVLMTSASYGKEKIGYSTTSKIRKSIKKIYTKIYFLKSNQSLLSTYFEFVNKLNNDTTRLQPYLKKTKTDKITVTIPKDYYIIFPSASIDLKRWNIDNYAKIAEYVYKKTKKTLVLCGTESDRKITEEFESRIKVPFVDLVGKTNLNDYIELIKLSKFVICNDTSIYHIAVINEIPVVIISGGYYFNKYIKYDFEGKNKYRQPYIVIKEKECFNCNENCPYIAKEDKIWPCLKEITVQNVIDKIDEMLNNSKGGSNESRNNIKTN